MIIKTEPGGHVLCVKRGAERDCIVFIGFIRTVHLQANVILFANHSDPEVPAEAFSRYCVPWRLSGRISVGTQSDCLRHPVQIIIPLLFCYYSHALTLHGMKAACIVPYAKN